MIKINDLFSDMSLIFLNLSYFFLSIIQSKFVVNNESNSSNSPIIQSLLDELKREILVTVETKLGFSWEECKA